MRRARARRRRPLRWRCCCCCRRRWRRWRNEAPNDVEPWATAPRHKFQPQTHDCRTVWDPRWPHALDCHNPSSASLFLKLHVARLQSRRIPATRGEHGHASALRACRLASSLSPAPGSEKALAARGAAEAEAAMSTETTAIPSSEGRSEHVGGA